MDAIFFIGVVAGTLTVGGCATALGIKYWRERQEQKEWDRLVRAIVLNEVESAKVIGISHKRPTK